jgi:hypothetical protein
MRGVVTTVALAAVLSTTLAAPSGAQSPAPAPSATAAVEAAAPSPVTITGKVEPDTVTIGSRFRYTIEVSAPQGTQIVLAKPTEKIGNFDIMDFGDTTPVERDGRTAVTRWFTLVGWDPGYHLIESPPILYAPSPGAEPVPAPTIETVITVASLLKDDTAATDIRDIKEPETVPTDWRPYWVAAGVLALLAVIGFVLYRVLNRSGRTAAAPPPRPAHEIAYEELARLRRLGLLQKGSFKEYYSGLSGIVRAYVERRFGVRAPEMTTEEFLLSSARESVLQSTHRGLLATFLGESDLVKFARHMPTLDDSERAFQAAKRFVDETAPAGEEAHAAR